ncbi:hypothetical protein GWK47_023576 [Chionoecetes opilio]|uniref:Uncharacterized protein n=1 Tax=Chionoecetes opilio TaxID=41210 RepID=A0A8J5CGC8_CHIOP|nr:hypothetical protein GWK47_023576 [Chionoecetes opilio]
MLRAPDVWPMLNSSSTAVGGHWGVFPDEQVHPDLPVLRETLGTEARYPGRPLGPGVQVFFQFPPRPVRPMLAALSLHLLFKLPVVRLLKPEKVDGVKSRLLFEVTEQAVLDTSEGSSPDKDEEDDISRRPYIGVLTCEEAGRRREDGGRPLCGAVVAGRSNVLARITQANFFCTNASDNQNTDAALDSLVLVRLSNIHQSGQFLVDVPQWRYDGGKSPPAEI